MAKFILSLFIVLISTSASALSDECIDQASQAVVDYLQKWEPTSKLQIDRNQFGEVLGLTDKAQIYGEFVFTDVIEDENGSIVIFHDGDFIVFVKVREDLSEGKMACIIDEVDSGQDDQD